MTSTIVKKEILENILSLRFPLFFLICAVLVLSAFYVNQADYAKRVSDYNEQMRLNDNAMKSSRMWDLVSGSVPLKGFRPPSPLSVFAFGFENSLPRYYQFLADGYAQGETSIGDESILSVQGKFDFLFIVQMVISLIVLLFASDLISGEKELGTLRGMFSNSVARHGVLLGKIFGGYIAAWLPFVITFLLGVILLSLGAFPLFDGWILPRVGIVFVCTSLFIMVYFTIGIMISASSARVRTSLVGILLVWILFQLIIPKLSDMVASLVYPIRTQTVVSMQKNLVRSSLEEEKAKLLGKKYESLFGVGARVTTDLEPPSKKEEFESFRKEQDQQYRERMAKQLGDIDDQYQREKDVQRSIANSLMLLSPGASLARISTDLCGTGEIDKGKYLEAVKNHYQILETRLYSRIERTTMIMSNGGTASTTTLGEMVDLKTLPAFSVQRATIAEVLSSDLGSLLSLVFWLIAPFGVAYVRFLRYDVR